MGKRKIFKWPEVEPGLSYSQALRRLPCYHCITVISKIQPNARFNIIIIVTRPFLSRTVHVISEQNDEQKTTTTVTSGRWALRGLSKCEGPFCVGAFDLQRCRPRGGLYLIGVVIYRTWRYAIRGDALSCGMISADLRGKFSPRCLRAQKFSAGEIVLPASSG